MKKIKYILIIFFGLTLLLPHLSFFSNEKKQETVIHEFSYHKWKNREYQKELEGYILNNYGNKSFLQQFRNQIDFTFFGEINNSNFVLGEDGYIFKKTEVEEYQGDNYVGLNYIKQYLGRIEYVGDKLEEKGAKLLVLIMPTKTYCLSDHLLLDDTTSRSNYNVLKREMTNYDVSWVDANNLFDQGSLNQSLYTKKGNQFSVFGTLGILDTIIKKSNTFLKTPLNKLIVDVNGPKNKVSLPNDLNLLYSSNQGSYEVPHYYFEESKPLNNDILCVGDSSFFELFNTEFTIDLFKKSSFWLNFKQEITTDLTILNEDLSHLNIVQSAEQNDIVLLVVHPSSLDNFSHGFVDYLYNFYSPDGDFPSAYSEYENECSEIRENLLSNKKSKTLIYKQAKQKGVNYVDNVRGHVESVISTQKKYLKKDSKRSSDYECQNILLKNQFLKLPHIRKAISDTAKRYNYYFSFAIDNYVRESLEYYNKEGFGSVRDSISPLQLEIYNVENRILSDSIWLRKVEQQAVVREITIGRNLWLNARFSIWSKYFEYYKTLDESQRWIGNLYYTNEILKKEKWLSNIQLMSEKFDVTFDDIFEENVRYLMYVNKDKLKLEFSIDEAKNIENQIVIRKNKAWSQKVREEAKDKGITYESCLRGNAAWVVYQKKLNK